VVCIDAMILLGYAQASCLESLEAFFGGGQAIAVTSAWLLENEIAPYTDVHSENQLIVDASWLHRVAVTDEDILYAQSLLNAWGSQSGRDRGEAEIVALCSRNGWTGCSDDRNAHGGARLAKAQGRPFEPPMVCGASLLAAAAAENLVAVDEAWTVHKKVEASYDEPPLLPTEDEFEGAFQIAVSAIRTRRNQLGSPPWPRLLTHGLDAIVRAAVRQHTTGAKR
jgi:hypothetical protein